LYVIGFDDWAGDIRTFKLERMEGARVLADAYTIPDDFDPEAHRASSWGIMSGEQIQEVVLRFAPTAKAYVLERQWHPSQQLEEISDGSVLLRIWVSEPLEMQPWIRSWGAQVEVLAPQDLRQRIADELSRAAGQYAGQLDFNAVFSALEIPPAAENSHAGGVSQMWPFPFFHDL
jgi:predicted DNA-binding transcriptional regulator YafY